MENISFSLRSNTDRRVYLHFEGWCFNYIREAGWRPFDNDLLSKNETNQESNLWLEPNGELNFNVTAQQFLKKFATPPDSLKMRIVYKFAEDNEKSNYIFTNSFVIN